MADHEDYLPGETPAAHKTTHQDGGADEISVAGLAGETAELAAHKILPTVHQDAPGLIETHRLVAGAHHARYTNGEAEAVADAQILTHKGDPAAHHARYTDVEAETVADAQILTHKGDPTAHQDAPELIETHRLVATAHQDAPGLIETHRLVAGAHHAKYTDAEVRSLFSPISVPPPAFIPRYETYDWNITNHLLQNRTTLTNQGFRAPVFFPDKVTVTKLTLYGFRDDALATMSLSLYQVDRVGNVVTMAYVSANWTSGYSSIADTSISEAVIDNINYQYTLSMNMDPNDSINDIKFAGSKIEFTG